MAWIAAIASVAGPILGGALGSSAQSSAANTQSQGAQSAAQIAANSQMQGLQFVQQQEYPYNQAGQQALGRYEQLLGLNPNSGSPLPQAPQSQSLQQAQGGAGTTGGLPQSYIDSGYKQNPDGSITDQYGNSYPAGSFGGTSPTQAQAARPTSGTPTNAQPQAQQPFNANSYFSSLPGYQFQMQQGQQAIQNSAAARGQALSGNTLQGLTQFGQGLAGEQFQQYMSQLAGLAGQGQAAASGVAQSGGNLIPGAGNALAAGVNASAQYNAAGQLGGYNQLSSGLTTAFNSPSFASGLQSLFGGGSGLPSAGDYASQNFLTS